MRERARGVCSSGRSRAEVKDADYIFIGFVVAHFPPGLVGLLVAVILCAAMSAVAAALDSLGLDQRGRLLSSQHSARSGRPALSARGVHPDSLLGRSWPVVFAAFAAQLDTRI